MVIFHLDGCIVGDSPNQVILQSLLFINKTEKEQSRIDVSPCAMYQRAL
jgi:hypothetical protein